MLLASGRRRASGMAPSIMSGVRGGQTPPAWRCAGRGCGFLMSGVPSWQSVGFRAFSELAGPTPRGSEEDGMQSSATPAKVAQHEGLVIGVALGLLLCLNFLLSVYANFGFTLITWLVGLAAYFWAGMRAGKTSHVTSSGLLAGLFTGVISSVINLVVVLPFTLLNVTKLRVAAQKALDQQVKTPHIHYTDASFIKTVIFGLVIGIVLAALFGIGLGAAGGALGRARAPLPAQQYEESLYQSPEQPKE